MKFQHILLTGEKNMMFLLFGGFLICFLEQIIVTLSKTVQIQK